MRRCGQLALPSFSCGVLGVVRAYAVRAGKAKQLAKAFPADGIRLDSFDAAAGAGPFYARCGFTERGRITYRDAPLIYFEFVLT